MNTTATISVVLAIIAVVGTLLAALITQLAERGRMREQHTLELDAERVQWTRDRRTDLYVRLTTLFRDAERTFNDAGSTQAESASITDKLEAMADELKVIDAEVKAKTAQIKAGESSVTAAERQKLRATAEQIEHESKRLSARFEQLAADARSQAARYTDINKGLNDQRMALEVLGSRKVKSLADDVLDEINKFGSTFTETGKTRKFDLKPLDLKWSQLNSAMREDLQVLD